MARKRQAEASALQLMWEKALMIGAGVVIFFHMWFTFARHFFAPENNFVYSELAKTLLKVDKWLGFVLFFGGGWVFGRDGALLSANVASGEGLFPQAAVPGNGDAAFCGGLLCGGLHGAYRAVYQYFPCQ